MILLSSDFFFLRSGDSCVCVRGGLRRGCGVLFLPFVIVDFIRQLRFIALSVGA